MDINGYVCLADFGMAKFIKQDEEEVSLCGTPEYLGMSFLFNLCLFIVLKHLKSYWGKDMEWNLTGGPLEF